MLLYLDVFKNSSNRLKDLVKFNKLRKYIFYFLHRNLHSLFLSNQTVIYIYLREYVIHGSKTHIES